MLFHSKATGLPEIPRPRRERRGLLSTTSAVLIVCGLMVGSYAAGASFKTEIKIIRTANEGSIWPDFINQAAAALPDTAIGDANQMPPIPKSKPKQKVQP